MEFARSSALIKVFTMNVSGQACCQEANQTAVRSLWSPHLMKTNRSAFVNVKSAAQFLRIFERKGIRVMPAVSRLKERRTC